MIQNYPTLQKYAVIRKQMSFRTSGVRYTFEI